MLNHRGAASQAQHKKAADELTGAGKKPVHELRADVGIAAKAERLVAGSIARFGRLDCEVNNADMGERIALDALDEIAFERTLRTNLTSVSLASQAAWPHMRERDEQ